MIGLFNSLKYIDLSVEASKASFKEFLVINVICRLLLVQNRVLEETLLVQWLAICELFSQAFEHLKVAVICVHWTFHLSADVEVV